MANRKKKIKIDDNRIIYANKIKDITIIEIKPEIDDIYNFLEIDRNIFYDENKIKYNSIYILQNNYISYGFIQDIKNGEMINNYKVITCSLGSPILNLNNNKVIGIHLGFRWAKLFKRFNVKYLLKILKKIIIQ